MKTLIRSILPICAVALAASTNAATVVVTATEPDRFTDARLAHMTEDASIEVLLKEFKKHLEQLSERYLADDQTVEINFTDIDLAGAFEPWRSGQFHDVRWVREIYIPRLAFEYKFIAPDGTVQAEGTEKLTDPSFQWTLSRFDDSPMRYEKEMLSRWIRQFRVKRGAPVS